MLSARLKQYYGRLRRPPGPLSLPGAPPVIGRDASDSTPAAGCRAGEGLPSSRRHLRNVPCPIRRGVPRGCPSRIFTASMAFALISGARLSLSPPSRAGLQRRRRLRVMLRTASSLPLHRAFDAGLRRWAFPPDTASLLPGLLAATRTGLTPAGDDELTNHDQPPTWPTSKFCWAYESARLGIEGIKAIRQDAQ